MVDVIPQDEIEDFPEHEPTLVDLYLQTLDSEFYTEDWPNAISPSTTLGKRRAEFFTWVGLQPDRAFAGNRNREDTLKDFNTGREKPVTSATLANYASVISSSFLQFLGQLSEAEKSKYNVILGHNISDAVENANTIFLKMRIIYNSLEVYMQRYVESRM